MLGLDAYASSSEEEKPANKRKRPRSSDADLRVRPEARRSGTDEAATGATARSSIPKLSTTQTHSIPPLSDPQPPPPSCPSDPHPPSPSGPLLGPSLPPPDRSDPSEPPSTPPSPRAQIRSLTLPPTPNLSIPSPPPGTPNPSTATKFRSLLALKREKGVSFNEKLASSRTFADPGLFPQVMGAFGLMLDGDGDGGVGSDGGVRGSEDGWPDQYVQTLGKEVLDVHGLPEWALGGGLERLQAEAWEERERAARGGKRERIEFVKGRGGKR